MLMIPTLVDQPPGTGFSYVPTNGYLHELEQVGVLLLQNLASHD